MAGEKKPSLDFKNGPPQVSLLADIVVSNKGVRCMGQCRDNWLFWIGCLSQGQAIIILAATHPWLSHVGKALCWSYGDYMNKIQFELSKYLQLIGGYTEWRWICFPFTSIHWPYFYLLWPHKTNPVLPCVDSSKYSSRRHQIPRPPTHLLLKTQGLVSYLSKVRFYISPPAGCTPLHALHCASVCKVWLRNASPPSQWFRQCTTRALWGPFQVWSNCWNFPSEGPDEKAWSKKQRTWNENYWFVLSFF